MVSIFLVFLLLCCKSQRLVVTNVEAPMFTIQVSSKAPKTLFNTWFHNFEDNKDDKILVYKTKDFDFKPSRGRTGFTILPKGKFIEHYPGSNDMPKSDTGKWVYSKHENMLEVRFMHIVAHPIPETDLIKKSYSLKIVSLDKNTLKVIKTIQ